jgi:prepilin-type N-terminal cleavage/methylation domain-containing protein
MTPRLPRTAQAGLTLIELMLTMMILSIVLGLGVGALSGLEVPSGQTVGLVRSALRAAATQAVSHEATCSVAFHREQGIMYPAELRVVGTWHFEDSSLVGAFGLNGLGTGVRVIDEGFIGKALSFAQSGSQALFAIEQDPAFDLSEGFVVEIAVKDPEGKGGRVLHIGHMVGIDLTPEGAVRGWFAPDFSESSLLGSVPSKVLTDSSANRATHLFVETESGAVFPDEWVRLRLEYDRSKLSLSIDGAPMSVLECEAPVRELVGVLGLSTTDRDGFRGEVDKLVVAAVSALEPIQLDDGAIFQSKTPKRVVFHGGGGLDPTVHSGPVEVGVEFVDGTTKTITVGILGTVE